MSMILNPYRYAGAGGGAPTFGNASRDFSGSSQDVGLGTFLETGAISFGGWIYLHSGFYSPILMKAGAYAENEADFGVYVPNSSAKIRMIVRGQQVDSGTITDVRNRWVHAFVTHDPTGDTKLYVDGNLEATQSWTGPSATGRNWKIGSWASANGFTNGLIADVRAYNREISASEVSDIYAGTHVSSGLIGWWLTDSDDTDDYSGEENHGTNNGSTYSTDGPFD